MPDVPFLPPGCVQVPLQLKKLCRFPLVGVLIRIEPEQEIFLRSGKFKFFSVRTAAFGTACGELPAIPAGPGGEPRVPHLFVQHRFAARLIEDVQQVVLECVQQCGGAAGILIPGELAGQKGAEGVDGIVPDGHIQSLVLPDLLQGVFVRRRARSLPGKRKHRAGVDASFNLLGHRTLRQRPTEHLQHFRLRSFAGKTPGTGANDIVAGIGVPSRHKIPDCVVVDPRQVVVKGEYIAVMRHIDAEFGV